MILPMSDITNVFDMSISKTEKCVSTSRIVTSSRVNDCRRKSATFSSIFYFIILMILPMSDITNVFDMSISKTEKCVSTSRIVTSSRVNDCRRKSATFSSIFYFIILMILPMSDITNVFDMSISKTEKCVSTSRIVTSSRVNDCRRKSARVSYAYIWRPHLPVFSKYGDKSKMVGRTRVL